MKYNEVKEYIEKLNDEEYIEFVKGLVSYEKGIDDENVLNTIYSEFAEDDSMKLLNSKFDKVINNIMGRENVTGNLLKDPEVVTRHKDNGEEFTVVNFAIANNKNETGEPIIYNCSAYGAKGELAKTYKKGDYVKVFGNVKTFKADSGKEYLNLNVLSSKMLKKANEMKEQNELKRKPQLSK